MRLSPFSLTIYSVTNCQSTESCETSQSVTFLTLKAGGEDIFGPRSGMVLRTPMTNDDSAENRLGKVFSASRSAYPYSHTGAGQQHAASPLTLENDPRLADLLEHAIRGSSLHERARVDAAGVSSCAAAPDLLHERLIEELATAQEQMRAEPQVRYAEQLEYTEPSAKPAALEEPDLAPFDLVEPETPSLPDLIAPAMAEKTDSTGPETVPWKAFDRLEKLQGPDEMQSQVSGAVPFDRAKALRQKARNTARRMRIRDWNRRRLALLSHIHRRVFDRRTEQLLFYKTPPLDVYHVEETEEGLQKLFFYEGPIPRKLLEWALSALPDNLKRYAFVDFRAGNGRTLLLAARRNFEYAAGYAFNAEGSELLEMNLAQYPRSYLACRDVRALRGDRDGVVIPSQPAVLFFPDSLSAGHLDIILTYVSSSLRLDPRPLYLIFENAGRERGREQMSLFKKTPLPLLNQAKAFLFAPARVAVYRSRIEIAD